MSLEEPVSTISVAPVQQISSQASVLEAAALMLDKDVSCLVVSYETSSARIVTERDILRKVTAVGRDPKEVRVG